MPIAEKVEPKDTVNPVFNVRDLHMKKTLPYPVIFLSLLFFILTGAKAMAQDSIPAAQKIRIFFANNVHAEIGPCG